MRRADRLFQIVLLLRRDRISTARKLAGELGISERTLYRDIQDLILSGIPIESEAGVGYRLPRSCELPALMFNLEELEVLVLGARMVETWGGESFQTDAQSLQRKVGAMLPEALRPLMQASHLQVPDFHLPAGSQAFMGDLRLAIRENRKIWIRYARPGAAPTERVLHPLGFSF